MDGRDENVSRCTGRCSRSALGVDVFDEDSGAGAGVGCLRQALVGAWEEPVAPACKPDGEGDLPKVPQRCRRRLHEGAMSRRGGDDIGRYVLRTHIDPGEVAVPRATGELRRRGSTTGAGGGRPGARYSGGIWTSTTVVAVAGMVEEVVVDGARQPRDVSVKERGALGCIVGLVDDVEVDSGSGMLVDEIVGTLPAVVPGCMAAPASTVWFCVGEHQ